MTTDQSAADPRVETTARWFRQHYPESVDAIEANLLADARARVEALDIWDELLLLDKAAVLEALAPR